MKQRNGKPRYLRHFAKAFIPCLIAAVLVGAVATAGLYGIRYKTVTLTNDRLLQDTYRELYDADITATPEKITEILAHNARVGENNPVDRAFLLERTDTGERFDSAAMLLVSCTDGCYYCTQEAQRAILEHLETVRQTHSGSPNQILLKIRDIYVTPDSALFCPGVVEYRHISGQSGRTETLDSLDLTPVNTGTLLHKSYGGSLLSCILIGNPPDSQALVDVRAMDGGDPAGSGAWIPEPGQLSYTGELFVSPENSRGVQCVLREVCRYHFWAEMKPVLLRGYALLLLLCAVTAAVTALVAYMRSRKLWEMNEYRRRLTNTLAHDLRAPLCCITGYAEHLKSGIHKEKQAHYTDAILHNAACMDRMIADVLALSVLEDTVKLHREETELVQLARDAFAPYAPQMEQRHLTLHIDGACPVLADGRMMAQAVGNLAANAVRYTPQGGEITVSGSGSQFLIANTCHETGDIRVLTQPFARWDAARSEHSSGLGLTIVKQIMTLHGFRFSLRLQDGCFQAQIGRRSGRGVPHRGKIR